MSQEQVPDELEQLRTHLVEAEAAIINAQDQLPVDHPVWLILDDYDGSMDSVQTLKGERDAARMRITELENKLAHPAVRVVAKLVEQREWERRRAEAAHEAKDEANRRWLAAVTDIVPTAEQQADNEADEPEIPDNPYPLGDPRGWMKFRDCVSDLCAAQRMHTPGCPQADVTVS